MLLALLRGDNLKEAAEFTLQHVQRKELLQALLEANMESALRFLKDFPVRSEAADIARDMLSGLPPKDIPTVAAWMEQQKDPVLRRAVMQSLMPRWLREDEASAVAAMKSIWDPQDLQIAQEKLKNHRMGDYQHAEARVEFIRNQPVEKQADLWASGGFISSMPERALPAVEQLPASPERTAAMIAMAAEWGSQDPLRAVQSATRLIDPALRATAFEGLTKGWSSVDSFRASQWVDSMPRGMERDAAATGLARELSAHQPDAAFSWAEGIDAPEQRRETLKGVLDKWKVLDGAAAAAAVQNSNLSSLERDALDLDPPPAVDLSSPNP